MVCIASAIVLTGCKSVELVAVPQQHTEHHWHTDSVFQRDSVVKECLTTVMQLDSAAMAKYGIQLKSAERAWLVKTQEMERVIQELMSRSATKDTVRDSVPVPYPVEKLVEKQLTWWQKTQMYAGDVLLLLLLAAFIYGGVKLRRMP